MNIDEFDDLFSDIDETGKTVTSKAKKPKAPKPESKKSTMKPDAGKGSRKGVFLVDEGRNQEELYYESDENDGRLGDTVLGDILAGVNGGADYEFKEVSSEDLEDGSTIGYQGTVINKSHIKTSLNKSGAVGVRAETEASRKLRESYIFSTKEDGTPIYNFNEDGAILDMEELISQGELVIKKETKHMGTLYFKECTKEEARDMIICGHYSHKFQGYFGKVNVGVYTEGRLVGVASFGGLMNPNSFKNFGDFGKDEILELNRLWVDDELGMNTETMLLSASWKIMRQAHPEIKVVQSFADGRLGAGTIYKATGFKYYGVESTLFFQDKVTKVISHKVGIENTKVPLSFMRLNVKYLQGRLQQFKVNTYRYIYPLYDVVEVPVLDESGVQRMRTVKKKDGSTMEVPMTERKKLEIKMPEMKQVDCKGTYKVNEGTVTEQEFLIERCLLYVSTDAELQELKRSYGSSLIEVTTNELVTVNGEQRVSDSRATDFLRRCIDDTWKDSKVYYMTETTLKKLKKLTKNVTYMIKSAYPEYQRGQNFLEGYEHPLNLLVRAYYLARIYNYSEDGLLYHLYIEWSLDKREGRYGKSYEDFCELSLEERQQLRRGTKWYDTVKLADRNGTIKELVEDAKESGQDAEEFMKRAEAVKEEFKVDIDIVEAMRNKSTSFSERRKRF